MMEEARRLARTNIDAFEASGDDAIVVTAAGCGAALKEYGFLLKDDPDYPTAPHASASASATSPSSSAEPICNRPQSRSTAPLPTRNRATLPMPSASPPNPASCSPPSPV